MGPEDCAGDSTPNRVIICLDGSGEEVQARYAASITAIREWFVHGGISVDLSAHCGISHKLVTTRHGGTLYVEVQYEGRSITYVLQGRNLYVRGWKVKGRAFELDYGQKENYILDKNCTRLPIGVNYRRLTPGGIGRTQTGLFPMRKAFNTLWSYNGDEAGVPTDVVEAVVVNAVHISDATRFQPVFNHTHDSMTDLNLSRLDKVTRLSIWVTKYRTFSGWAMEIINCLIQGKNLPQLPFERYGLNVTSVTEFLDSIRVLFLDALYEGVFSHAPPPKGPIFECLMDERGAVSKDKKHKGRKGKGAGPKGGKGGGGQKEGMGGPEFECLLNQKDALSNRKKCKGRKEDRKGKGSGAQGWNGGPTGGVAGPPCSFHSNEDWILVTEKGGVNSSLPSTSDDNVPILKTSLIFDYMNHDHPFYKSYLPPSWCDTHVQLLKKLRSHQRAREEPSAYHEDPPKMKLPTAYPLRNFPSFRTMISDNRRMIHNHLCLLPGRDNLSLFSPAVHLTHAHDTRKRNDRHSLCCPRERQSISLFSNSYLLQCAISCPASAL